MTTVNEHMKFQMFGYRVTIDTPPLEGRSVLESVRRQQRYDVVCCWVLRAFTRGLIDSKPSSHDTNMLRVFETLIIHVEYPAVFHSLRVDSEYFTPRNIRREIRTLNIYIYSSGCSVSIRSPAPLAKLAASG